MLGERFVAFSFVKRTTVLCLLTALLLASRPTSAQEYSFRNFVASDGLGNLSAQKIYQDPAGFIWISTENGIFRYNGDRFESFDASHGVPSVGGVAFGQAPDGSLLMGASIGLYRLTGKRFEKLSTPFNTVSWTQGIQSDTLGDTYLGTESGLFEMTSQSGQTGFTFHRIYPAPDAPPETVYGVFIDADTIWFGCGLKLCRMEHGETKVFGEESGLLNVPLVVVLKDHDGNLWVRARNEGVLEWPAGEERFRRPDTPVPGRALTGTPALDHDGRILLGTSDGLLVQHEKGWQLIDRHVGMRGGVFAAFEDRQHSLWMGTGGHGLTQWRGYQEWESYSSASGLPSDDVFEMLPQADGSIWVGMEAGLVHGQPQGFGIVWKTVPETKGIPVHSLQMTSSGDLWIGTASRGIALLHVRTGKLQWYDATQGLSGRLVFTVRLDRNQQLWAATEKGLFVASAPYQKFSRVAELPSTWFWTVAEADDGTIWAGGADGLFAFASGSWQHWNHASGLSNQSVVSLRPDRDGAVWVGYEHGGGIDRVHLSQHGVVIQKGVQRPGSDGLIYFLDFDRSGSLWAGTERGLDVWDGAYWRHYDTTDGLVWDDCDLGAFASGPDGSLWFGTGGGLSHFKPHPDKSSATPPSVMFTDLLIGQTDILGAQHQSFPMSSGALTASFSAPNATQDSSLLFRYRLEGARSPWTETTQRQLEFARLAPGTYELEVQVRDSRGIWSSQTAKFSFSIQTPWYRRGWFIALLALVPFLIAVVVFRIRFIGTQRRERQLQQIVADKTSDLRKANEELLRLTMVDALTGVANRRHFDQTLAQECERVKRSGSTISLLLIDVDHFKALNDSAGHQKGDEYLMMLGLEFLRAARQQIDLVARIGGEEFAFILPSTNALEAAQIAERLRLNVEALNLPHPASSVAASLTVSIGVATATQEQHCSPEELVGAADQALYRAKDLGRNRVQIA